MRWMGRSKQRCATWWPAFPTILNLFCFLLPRHLLVLLTRSNPVTSQLFLSYLELIFHPLYLHFKPQIHQVYSHFLICRYHILCQKCLLQPLTLCQTCIYLSLTKVQFSLQFFSWFHSRIFRCFLSVLPDPLPTSISHVLQDTVDTGLCLSLCCDSSKVPLLHSLHLVSLALNRVPGRVGAQKMLDKWTVFPAFNHACLPSAFHISTCLPD